MPAARLLILAYALSGAGLVAPMVYLGDLAARGRGLGIAAGASIWLLFGLGGLVGTLAGGAAADRFGGRRALLAWLGLQVLALGLLLLSALPVSALPVPALPALILGAALAGFVGVGVTSVVLAVARERAGAEAAVTGCGSRRDSGWRRPSSASPWRHCSRPAEKAMRRYSGPVWR